MRASEALADFGSFLRTVPGTARDSLKQAVKFEKGAPVAPYFPKSAGPVTSVAKGGSNAALRIMEMPVTATLQFANWTTQKVVGVYAHAPKLAWGVTALAAIAGIGSFFSKRNEEQSNAYYQAQAASLQAGPSYMNNVTAQESAALDASLKQNGTASFADAASQRSGEPTVKAL
jgi:hypothetical protein